MNQRGSQSNDHLSARSTRNLYLAKRHGPRLVPYLTLLQDGFTLRFGLRRNPVGSYPTISPLPHLHRRQDGSHPAGGEDEAVYFLWHFPDRGVWSSISGIAPGFLALWSPDFPPFQVMILKQRPFPADEICKHDKDSPLFQRRFDAFDRFDLNQWSRPAFDPAFFASDFNLFSQMNGQITVGHT